MSECHEHLILAVDKFSQFIKALGKFIQCVVVVCECVSLVNSHRYDAHEVLVDIARNSVVVRTCSVSYESRSAASYQIDDSVEVDDSTDERTLCIVSPLTVKVLITVVNGRNENVIHKELITLLCALEDEIVYRIVFLSAVHIFTVTGSETADAYSDGNSEAIEFSLDDFADVLRLSAQFVCVYELLTERRALNVVDAELEIDERLVVLIVLNLRSDSEELCSISLTNDVALEKICALRADNLSFCIILSQSGSVYARHIKRCDYVTV